MTIFKTVRNSLLAAVAFALSAGMAQAENVKITLLGVGDIYKFDGSKARGGVARLNAVARAEKAANPNTLYLFDGDMFSPSLLSGLDKGENMVKLTEIVPFDLAVPGNHEFDFGPELFMERIKGSKYPWAAINITKADGSAIEGLGGVMMKEVGGVKVAIVPVAQDTTPQVASSGDLKFGATSESAIAAAKQARKDGAEIIVGLVQAPHSDDQKMMASKAFDVILSGDDHDLVVQYNGITAYVDTSTDANYLVPIDLNVTVEEKDGKRSVKWEPNFRFIDTASVTPDPETMKVVEDYQKQLDNELNVVIGKTSNGLDSRRNVVRTQEAAIGNLIADAMRDVTGADVAIMNGGGIRADKEYAAGSDISRKDILTELPFGNTTVVTELPGSQVLLALENGVSQVEKGAGRFPQVSGLTFAFDAAAEPGSRVSAVMVGGAPLEADKLYKVAVNDYIVGGGDGYAALGGGRILTDGPTGQLVATDVMAYVEKLGTVAVAVEGRITKLGQ